MRADAATPSGDDQYHLTLQQQQILSGQAAESGYSILAASSPGLVVCPHLSRSDHPPTICPKRAAELRGETTKCLADAERGGNYCLICHAKDHRAHHHSLAALDYAGQSGVGPHLNQSVALASPGGVPGGVPGGGMLPPGQQIPSPPAPHEQSRAPPRRRCTYKGKCFRLRSSLVGRSASCTFYHPPEDVEQARLLGPPEAAEGQGQMGAGSDQAQGPSPLRW